MGGSCYDRIGPLAFCGFVVNEWLVFLFWDAFFGIVRKSRAPCLKKNAVFLSFFYSRVAGTKQQAGARPKKTLSS
jgi:hypothetical protein